MNDIVNAHSDQMEDQLDDNSEEQSHDRFGDQADDQLNESTTMVENTSALSTDWSVAAGDMQAAEALKAQMLEKATQDLKRRTLNVDDENEEDDVDLDAIEDILALPDDQYPRFTLAKNKARFLRMVSWYKNKQEWLEVAPLSGVTKLFKQQTKELVGIRASKLDYEMELETGTLTPSQRSYRRDELKMCKVHEKMAVNLIARMQVKIKSGRR